MFELIFIGFIDRNREELIAEREIIRVVTYIKKELRLLFIT